MQGTGFFFKDNYNSRRSFAMCGVACFEIISADIRSIPLTVAPQRAPLLSMASTLAMYALLSNLRDVLS
jgi:hypothetical protein